VTLNALKPKGGARNEDRNYRPTVVAEKVTTEQVVGFVLGLAVGALVWMVLIVGFHR
jgi:tetrahydromethanopterin S-methyltransferase subunit B